MERFREVYNAKFSNGIGNLVSRVAKMIDQFCGGELLKPTENVLATFSIADKDTRAYILELREKYHTFMNEVKLNEAVNTAWKMLADCDGYIQDYEPFKLIKTENEKGKAVLWNAALLLLSGVQLLQPTIPETAEKIFKIFGVREDNDMLAIERIKGKSITPLFPRLEEK